MLRYLRYRRFYLVPLSVYGRHHLFCLCHQRFYPPPRLYG
jgi:hypothetical protein